MAYNKEDQFLLFEYRIGSRMDIQFAMKDGVVTAVLDIDSDRLDTFDEIDAIWLEKIAAIV